MLEPIIYGNEVINLPLAIKITYENGTLRIIFTAPSSDLTGRVGSAVEVYEGQAAKDIWDDIKAQRPRPVRARKSLEQMSQT